MQFSDVLVAPYDGLWGKGAFPTYHRGGPIWPDWDNQTTARHCVNGRAVDDCPLPPDTFAEIDAAQWCGPIWRQFGHMLAEFGMRILPSALNGIRAPLLFYGFPDAPYRKRRRPLGAAPAAFREILAYADLRPRDVRVALDGLKVATLHVEPQAEQLYNVGPSPAHLDLLEGHAERMLGPVSPCGPVFVSRAGMFARFAGEGYIESVLEAAGVRVIRPETLPLAEQLKIYRDAGLVLFSEGSALHAPQLLGRCFDRVAVFAREDGSTLNRVSLTPRCRQLDYHAFLTGRAEMLGPDGQPRRMSALSLIDAQGFLAAMRGIGLAVDHLWDARAWRAAEIDDAEAWLTRARGTPLWANPGTTARVGAALRRQFGDRFRIG